MACGVKTNNGVIGMDTLGLPVASVLEAAEARGMATGLVVTSTISHATPAVFSAHVPNRNDQSEIARQQLELGIDVLFGGGEAFYLPSAEGGRRDDALNLFDKAAEKGYAIVQNRDQLMDLESLPAVGIFTEGQMTFEIDRDTTLEPSLSEMTRKAIELLDDDPNGFFLMVEGSRIDHAGHGHDAAAHLHEILEFDKAFEIAADFASENGETLVVSTSDHETGGLSLGRDGIYGWWPGVLDRIPSSLGLITEMAIEENADMCSYLQAEASVTCSTEDSLFIQQADSLTFRELYRFAGNAISKAAGIGWTSTGHTAVDVNVYAYGPGAGAFQGNQDNTMIARTIADVMDFDLESITASLRAMGDSGAGY
jgi:alkaline phosphatase